MQRRSLFAGFMAGLVAAVVMMIVSSAGPEVPRAMAQESPAGRTTSVALEPVPPPPPPAAPRYQISAWGTQLNAGGAFIIDTQTGVIWQYYRSDIPLRKVGKVPAE
jgi:hypothetical protein